MGALARPEVVDAVITVGFGAFALGALFTAGTTPPSSTEPDLLGAVLVVLACGALAFRRRWPLGVLVIVAGASLSLHLLEYPDAGTPFAVVLALYTLASMRDRRLVVSATAVLLVAAPIAFWATGTVEDGGTLVGTLAVFVLAAVWGDRKKVRVAYDEQVELREAEQAQQRVALRGASRRRGALAHREGAARRPRPCDERGCGAVRCRRPRDRQPSRRGQADPRDDQRDESGEHEGDAQPARRAPRQPGGQSRRAVAGARAWCSSPTSSTG